MFLRRSNSFAFLGKHEGLILIQLLLIGFPNKFENELLVVLTKFSSLNFIWIFTSAFTNFKICSSYILFLNDFWSSNEKKSICGFLTASNAFFKFKKKKKTAASILSNDYYWPHKKRNHHNFSNNTCTIKKKKEKYLTAGVFARNYVLK